MFVLTLLEDAETITTSGIFTEAGNTMTGIVGMAGNFFVTLWANPMGKIIATLGLVAAAVGLCFRLYIRRKHV